MKYIAPSVRQSLDWIRISCIFLYFLSFVDITQTNHQKPELFSQLEVILYFFQWNQFYPNNILSAIYSLLTGGSGPKILKTYFRDIGWTKRSAKLAHFLVGFRDPKPFDASVAATPIFPPKIGFFLKKHQNHDFSPIDK